MRLEPVTETLLKTGVIFFYWTLEEAVYKAQV